MGGFMGIGHSSAKTDRSNFLGGLHDINNIFNYALPVAKGEVAAGEESLTKAGDYWKKLLSGDRTAMLQAVAPETASVTAKADAAKRQLSTSGTARGGGTAGANQTIKDRAMAEIDQLLFGVRPEAAKATADIGRTRLGAGLSFTGLGEKAAGDIASLSAESRKTSQAINQQTVGNVSQAILNVMAAFV